ncbi:molybdenum cofactor cytidylyltransferase [Desulfitobacterium hafniense]|uniref:MobA-like NTP transferase domain-containing protein n=1 Tax=Desulfitobacterium hafniense (strain Y51) TaxID=138119 RepID=Q24Z85_DESHY|nr:molybdenum cofactor cytidylyltransferase [Desulfitobacterium hafniense]BAE82657.1 hypothetical protein DSY0868 [Desulfitobacterium hafniense Y51]
MISAIVLAAGKSSRMGQMKLLLPIAGLSMIRAVVENVLRSQADEVIIVLGNEADRVRNDIELLGAGDESVKSKLKIVENLQFAEGQSTSLKVGLSMVNEQSAGALILMGDQPFVGTEIIDTIIECFLETVPLMVVPQYPEGRASPVLFARDLFPELMAVTGDKGGRSIVMKCLETERRHHVSIVEVKSGLAGRDIDTWEEFLNVSATGEK